MIGSARRWRRSLKRTLVLLAVGGMIWGGWRAWEMRRERSALAEVQKEIQAGRYEVSARRLIALLDQRPDLDEAAYLLGQCENARGRPDAASAAWARVRPGSEFIAPAILGRAELLTRRGCQGDAEQLVERPLGDPRIEGSSLRWFLLPFYWQEGRVEEAERLLEADWDHLPQSAGDFLDQSMKLVQAHMRLTQNDEPDPGFRRDSLRQAEQLAPDDDRVWLAKANLAISRAAFDEAARLLDSCLRRRPEDVPVWKAHLRWAMSTNRVAEVQKALRHIPADATTPAQVDRLAVWLAATPGGCRVRTARVGTARRGRPRRPRRLGPSGRVGRRGRPAGLRRRTPSEEDRPRSSQGTLSRMLSAQSALARRGGDGPPGGTARPLV